MPPLPQWYRGRDDAMAFAGLVPRGLRVVAGAPDQRNGQPAVALSLDVQATRRDGGPPGVHRAWSVTVLALREGAIAELTSFVGPEGSRALGLPLVLD